jgi:hypothetical protein
VEQTYVIPFQGDLSKATWVQITEERCTVALEKIEEIGADGYVWVRKKREPSRVYAVKPGSPNLWRCAKCGSELLAARIAQPIWDGPFPCSGSGKCHYENAPYCPTCETKPSSHGSLIEVENKVP